MRNALDFIKPAVLQAQAYTLRHFSAPVKINQNENPFDMPDAIKAAVAARMAQKEWSRYPAFVPEELISSLAQFSGWRSDGILVGNGSNELIEAVLVVSVEPGKRVVIPQPTFTLYKLFSQILGGECQEVLLTPELEFDLPRLVEASRTASVTIICCPNNPTGCVLNLEQLRRLLSSTGGLVVIDEAYHEFSRQSAVPLLEEFPHLVVLRTFSKAMAMAGLRVGYLLAAPALVEQISKAKLPYNLNVFSLTAAETAVEHFSLLQPRIELLIAERERVFQELGRIPGIRPFPSKANFIVFRTEFSAGTVFNALYASGVLVRDVSHYPMLEGFLRVSIGSPPENDRFLESLQKFMMSASQPAATGEKP